MLLCKESIQRQIGSGRVGIYPSPDEIQYQPASLDVRLDSEVYDLVGDEYFDVPDGITLDPGACLLTQTFEEIRVPNDLAVLLTGRSSVGRRFVSVHCTAGLLDPGFHGKVTFEMKNMGPVAQTFEVGDRVGQLLFFELDRPTEEYQGQYDGQQKPTKAGDL